MDYRLLCVQSKRFDVLKQSKLLRYINHAESLLLVADVDLSDKRGENCLYNLLLLFESLGEMTQSVLQLLGFHKFKIIPRITEFDSN